MATLAATYDYPTYGTAFCAAVGITAGARAEGLLARSCTAGDQFMGNPFDGSTDRSPTTHPLDIWEGIIAYASILYRLSPGAAGAGSGMTPGLMGVTTGSLTENYGAGASGKGLTPSEAALEAARDCWWPFKLKPWR